MILPYMAILGTVLGHDFTLCGYTWDCFRPRFYLIWLYWGLFEAMILPYLGARETLAEMNFEMTHAPDAGFRP